MDREERGCHVAKELVVAVCVVSAVRRSCRKEVPLTGAHFSTSRSHTVDDQTAMHVVYRPQSDH